MAPANLEQIKANLFDTCKAGEVYLYPSTTGTAIPCQVVGKSETDIIIAFRGENIYLPAKQWNAHAVPKPGIRITDIQRDDDNTLTYVRYVRTATWIDRLYNWYVKRCNAVL